jgi:hypothetical protein
MPAGFNTGQIEYIKAIANVNGHKTYKDISYNRNAASSATAHLNFQTSDGKCRYGVWCLGQKPVVRDSSGNIGVTGAAFHELDAFNIPKSTNSDGIVYETQREGDEGFLESTHLNMRLLLPHTDSSSASTFNLDHVEFRMIVFRARDRQHHLETHLKDTNNFLFNLFRGNRNHAIGFAGLQRKEEIDGNLNYDAHTDPDFSGIYNVQGQDAMTVPINKESWVVMRDHRFYLGKEYGGKNIYEDAFHWDWKDPIATSSDDVTETDNEKNYTWYIMLMANNNSLISQDNPTLSIRFTGTTHMTSG